jgi:hypothetical protein
MFDNDVDMSTLDSVDPQAAAEVRTFAADVSSSCAVSFSLSLEVDVDSFEVLCFYRQSDATTLDLLTLTRSCASSRRLRAVDSTLERRLQVGGFVLEMQMFGVYVDPAAQFDDENTGQSAAEILASKLARAEIFIDSTLLPEGNTVRATLKETKVEVATEAPVPAPTAAPLTFRLSPGIWEAPQSIEEAQPPLVSAGAVIMALLVVIICLLLVIIFGLVFVLKYKAREPQAHSGVDQEKGFGDTHVAVNGWTGSAESER